jgi:hypothetical protein
MTEQAPRLRVVGSDGGRPSRRAGPGLGVVSVLAYALLFGGALWYLRARSPLGHSDSSRPAETSRPRAAAVVPAPEHPSPQSRESLLSGEAVAPSARPEYFRHLASDRCDCGCDRTLSDCLANEKSCSRSPRLAEEARRKLR